MGFDVNQVAEVLAENIRYAYRHEPDLRLSGINLGQRLGHDLGLGEVPDRQLIRRLGDTPLGQAAAKLTARQVGTRSWMAYRSEVTRPGHQVYATSGRLSRDMERQLRGAAARVTR